MNRKVTVVGGAGNVGQTVARVGRRERARRRRHHRHRQGQGDGRRARHLPVVLDLRIGCAGGRRRRLFAQRRFRRRRDHLRRAAQAGHEPRRSGADQLQDHEGGDRAGGEVLAQHHHRASGQPARRDVPGRLQAERVPARARHRHGRRARLGAHERVPGDGAERVGEGHPCRRARRPRRRDGAAAALLDGGRPAAHRAARGGSDRGDLQAHGRAAAAS